jgi:HEAT repeat protein
MVLPYARQGDVDGLARLAASDDLAVAQEAVRALGTAGPQGRPHLVEALADARPPVRVATVLALGRADDGESEARLADAARRDKAPDVRAAAVTILGRRLAHRQMPTLIDALEDPDPLVRRRAAEAFRRITGMGLATERLKTGGSGSDTGAVAAELRAMWPFLRETVEAYYENHRGPAEP